MYKVTIKWGKQKFENVELDTSQPPLMFKTQLFSLTGVTPERQTLMGKGGTVKDDTDWGKLGVKDGFTFMLMGTAEALPAQPVQQPVFVEDLLEKQQGQANDAPPGLENLGNTCYMNATMQVLRSVPELDTALSKLPPASTLDAPSTISDGLRRLFSELNTSRSTVTPFLFLQILRAAHPQFAEMQNGRPMQQDAEECWTELVNSLNRKLKDAAGKSFIEQYFNIEFEHRWKNTEDDTEEESVTRDSQNKLQCHITKDVNYLHQGIAEGLKEEVEKLSPALQRKALYRKTSLITRLPSYLTVNFVRFFWRRDTNKKAKILRKVKFPVVLDLYNYCTDDLKKQLDPLRAKFRTFDEKQAEKKALEKRKKNRREEEDGPAAMDVEKAVDKDGSVSASSSAPPMSETTLQGDDAHRASLTGYNIKSLPPVTGENRSGLYELAAVLTHIGRSSDSGHYMAWVRHEGDNWWKFDDDNVSPVTTEDILKLDGGGDWHMAYVCLYRERTLPADFQAASAEPTSTAAVAAQQE